MPPACLVRQERSSNGVPMKKLALLVAGLLDRRVVQALRRYAKKSAKRRKVVS